MNKTKTTMKHITDTFSKVYCCGYCDLQTIMAYEKPRYYNSGVYGWNCDIYVNYTHDIAISTGYRNMKGTTIPRELIQKYNTEAKAIRETMKYNEVQTAMDDLVNRFYNELATL